MAPEEVKALVEKANAVWVQWAGVNCEIHTLGGSNYEDERKMADGDDSVLPRWRKRYALQRQSWDLRTEYDKIAKKAAAAVLKAAGFVGYAPNQSDMGPWPKKKEDDGDDA